MNVIEVAAILILLGQLFYLVVFCNTEFIFSNNA